MLTKIKQPVTIFLVVTLNLFIFITLVAQDAAITAEPLSTESPTPSMTASWTASATEILPPTATPTPPATVTATALELPTAEVTAETTLQITAEVAPTEMSTLDPLPPPEETEAVTETTLPFEATTEVTASATAPSEATVETTAVVTALPEATAEVTETIAPTPETTETAEATAADILVPIVGLARYQSRSPDNAGITITILDTNGNIISTTITDSLGLYTVVVPAEGLIEARFEAPLHRRVTVIAPSNAVPSEIILAGGDLNQDGCIGITDIALLTVQFEISESVETDINGDGLTEAADLAILAGNYEHDCEAAATPEPESTAEATSDVTVTPETTATFTNETPEATMAPEATLTGSELSPEPATTTLPVPEATTIVGG